VTTDKAPILVVDDNSTNLKLIRVLLEREGYEVRTAADAEQAVVELNHFHPQLILMDIQLPGVEVVSRVLWKNEEAQSSGKLERATTQPAADHGGHRRTTPWRSVPRSGSRSLTSRPSRSAS
jgi:CheY-like chemotaxis protein